MATFSLADCTSMLENAIASGDLPAQRRVLAQLETAEVKDYSQAIAQSKLGEAVRRLTKSKDARVASRAMEM